MVQASFKSRNELVVAFGQLTGLARKLVNPEFFLYGWLREITEDVSAGMKWDMSVR